MMQAVEREFSSNTGTLTLHFLDKINY